MLHKSCVIHPAVILNLMISKEKDKEHFQSSFSSIHNVIYEISYIGLNLKSIIYTVMVCMHYKTSPEKNPPGATDNTSVDVYSVIPKLKQTITA